jgi:DNA-binding NarL/FixJ family response regulator
MSTSISKSPPQRHPKLTPRESQVLALLLGGLQDKAICDKLKLSHSTVRGLISILFIKHRVGSRLELVIQCLTNPAI